MDATEMDQVDAWGQAVLQRMEVMIGELDALSTAWKQRLHALTRLERKDVPDYIPGWHDYSVSAKGVARSLERLLATRRAIKPQSQGGPDSGPGLDHVACQERDNKDRAKIRNCSLQPHQAQWDAIKRSHGLLALSRRFGTSTGEVGPTIDAVVECGAEWLKVLATTEKKLHSQMAEEGWHPDDSSDDEPQDSDGDESGIHIINITKQLVNAARSNRCSTRPPRIRLVLPKVASPDPPAIDKLFKRVRSLGISKRHEGDVEILVDCASSDFWQRPIPPLSKAFDSLFRDTNIDRLTPTLNLELTFLLGMVSDIAHGDVEPQTWFSSQSMSHIRDEKHAPGRRLQRAYSALRGRSLECTQSVARELKNLVDDIGTQSTKARAMVLFGRQSMQQIDTPRSHRRLPFHGNADGVGSVEESGASCRAPDGDTLISELRKLSRHPVPDDLQLPIQVVGEDEFHPKDCQALIVAGRLPAVAAHVCAELDRPYTVSCHLWGWLTGNTTFSANPLTVRKIEAVVDKKRCSPLEMGPQLCISSLAVSVNSVRPCPQDKWDEIKEYKHMRKDTRTKEAKQLKANGTWGPSLGVPVTWDQEKLKGHAQKKGDKS